MPEILSNSCYGGFGFSDEFCAEFMRLYPDTPEYYLEVYTCQKGPARTDPRVIALFKKMGRKASSGQFAHLTLETIPDDLDYYITDYDGIETIEWELPLDTIIRDLVRHINGTATTPMHELTRRMIDEDLTHTELRRIIQSEARKTKSATT